MRRALVPTAVLAALVLLPFMVGASVLTTAVFIAIAAIGAHGLNVLTGYSGQISLGHAFFLAAGAYTCAVLGGNLGLSAAIWIPAAGVVSAICGALAAPTAVRLRGLYLAIVTIGLVFIGQYVFYNVGSISGGPQGRAFPSVELGPFDFAPGQTLELGSLVIDRNGLYYYLALALLVVSTAFVYNLARSRPGRAMEAIRERELAAAVMGVNVTRTKFSAFVVASFFAGISGALYASFIGFVQPDHWNLVLSVQYVAIVILGGIGTVYGPVLGAIVVIALPELIEKAPFVSESSHVSAGDLTLVLYGLLIIAIFALEPRGLAGLGERISGLVREATGRLAGNTPATATPERTQ